MARIACIGPLAARFPSTMAMAMSSTLTSGEDDAPSCAVTREPSGLPPPPVDPSPYPELLPPLVLNPPSKSLDIASFPESFVAKALGAPRAMPTRTSAAFACRVVRVAAASSGDSSDSPESAMSESTSRASRSRSSSGVSHSHAL